MLTPRRTRPSRKVLLPLAAAALVLGAAACGDDDDNSAASDTSPVTQAESPTTRRPVEPGTTLGGPATTAGGTDTTAGGSDTTAGGSDTTAADTAGGSGAASAEVEAFCRAEVEAEAAAMSEDPATAGPAFEALVDAAPEEIRPAAEAVVANADAGPGDPAFEEPYGEMIDYMREHCGFNELSVTGTEYSFDGLSPELPAGPTIVEFENAGNEVHEVVFLRIREGVTESIQELLELPEEEAMEKADFQAVAFAFPGTTSTVVTDFTPGRYAALCFLPVGAAPEVVEQMEGPEDTPPEGVELGPPHFTMGMVHEFTVA